MKAAGGRHRLKCIQVRPAGLHGEDHDKAKLHHDANADAEKVQRPVPAHAENASKLNKDVASFAQRESSQRLCCQQAFPLLKAKSSSFLVRKARETIFNVCNTNTCSAHRNNTSTLRTLPPDRNVSRATWSSKKKILADTTPLSL